MFGIALAGASGSPAPMSRIRAFGGAPSAGGCGFAAHPARSARGAQRSPHHRPRRLAARHFDEAGAIEHRLGAEPHEVVDPALRLVARIGFEQRRALLARPRRRALQQRLGHAAMPRLRVDEETDDRPHRLRVDGLHHRRARELRVVLARAERYPADGAALLVAEEARHDAAIDQRLQRALVVLRIREAGGDLVLAGAAIAHAVAAARDRCARAREQLDEIVPAIGGQRLDFELHSGCDLQGEREVRRNRGRVRRSAIRDG